MSTQTQHLALIKPAENETADIGIINQNMDKIDAAVIAKLLEAKGYTDSKIQDLINSAPGALDTLKELSAALGDDPNFRTTIINLIATKVSQSEFEGFESEVNVQLGEIAINKAEKIDLDNTKNDLEILYWMGGV